MGDLAMTALHNATREFHGDTNRTYLTGISMGGYGSWYLAQKYPHTFAALVIICGGIHPPVGDAEIASRACEVFAARRTESVRRRGRESRQSAGVDFSWRDDNIVPVVESQRMADAMKTIGAEVHYTEYPGVKHVSWDKAYDEPKLYPWLYSKTLADRGK